MYLKFGGNAKKLFRFIRVRDIQRYAELRAKGDLTLNERLEMLTVHRESLNEQIKVLQEHMAKLDDKIDFYRQEIERTSLK